MTGVAGGDRRGGARGVLYSVGAAFHVWTSLRYQNVVWHGFVLAAAGCHYTAVLREVAAG